MKNAVVLASIVAALAIAACGSDAPPQAPDPTSQAESPGDAWTMLGHDVRSSFHNPNETSLSVITVPQLQEAWSLADIGTVTGAPAIVDGRVYVLGSNGTFALDAATGEQLWSNPDVTGTSSVTYSDGVLFVDAGPSVVHALDAETGDELWQAEVDPHPQASGFSSPVVAGGLVIVGSASGEEAAVAENATFRGAVVAFDRETGDEVWRHYTVEPPHNGVAVWSSVSVDLEAGVVFASTGNNYTGEAGPTSDSIFALDLATGELLWLTQLTEGDVFTILNPQSEDTDFGTNPILFEAGGRKLLGNGQKSGAFYVLDRETGEVVWSRQVSGGSPLIGGVFNNGAYDGERIIVAGNNGTSEGPGSEPANGESEPLGAAARTPTSVLMAMNPADGSVLWERQLPAWVWAPITIANGVGYVSTESTLQAFDVTTGEKLFEFDTEGTIASGAAVAGGRVVFGSGLAYFGTTPGQALHALALP
ncbi:MAG: PQQ-binding-like beta-propeller repeat protein [Dehalococcoidia bacterium]